MSELENKRKKAKVIGAAALAAVLMGGAGFGTYQLFDSKGANGKQTPAISKEESKGRLSDKKDTDDDDSTAYNDIIDNLDDIKDADFGNVLHNDNRYDGLNDSIARAVTNERLHLALFDDKKDEYDMLKGSIANAAGNDLRIKKQGELAFETDNDSKGLLASLDSPGAIIGKPVVAIPSEQKMPSTTLENPIDHDVPTQSEPNIPTQVPTPDPTPNIDSDNPTPSPTPNPTPRPDPVNPVEPTPSPNPEKPVEPTPKPPKPNPTPEPENPTPKPNPDPTPTPEPEKPKPNPDPEPEPIVIIGEGLGNSGKEFGTIDEARSWAYNSKEYNENNCIWTARPVFYGYKSNGEIVKTTYTVDFRACDKPEKPIDPPTITVGGLADGMEIENDIISFSVSTLDGNGKEIVPSVTLNGKVIVGQGESYTATLVEGNNLIVIIATDEKGNVTKKTFTIKYVVEEPEEPVEPIDPVDPVEPEEPTEPIEEEPSEPEQPGDSGEPIKPDNVDENNEKKDESNE